jgi:transcriptional regulator with XRE-family HTH domain
MNLTQCRMARAALELGVRELAELAGVSPDTVSRFERGELPRGKTVEVLQAALEARGIEFTNGGQPGVRWRPIDFAAVEASPWSPWKLASGETDAITKVRREWPGLLAQRETSHGPIFFIASPIAPLVVAEAEPAEMGGSWRYRMKPRSFEPLPTATPELEG